MKRNIFGFILAPLLAVALAIGAGCTTLQNIGQAVEESPMTAQLVTNQLTLRIIAAGDDPVARATKFRDVVSKIRLATSGDQRYTLADIDTIARQQIPWQSLSLADQELLDQALTYARNTLTNLIGEGLVDGTERHTIDTLLTWIDNAALRVQ